MSMLHYGCCALLCWCSFSAFAETAGPQREQIRAERAAANARFAEQERECRQRFVVVSCVDDARREQRSTLMRLRRHEAAIDEGQRREAAAARRQAIVEKPAARANQAEPAPRRELERKPPKLNPPRAEREALPRRRNEAKAGPEMGKPVTAADQRLTEQRNEAAFEARQRAATMRRESSERRHAERAIRGKVAAPLPVPSAASAP